MKRSLLCNNHISTVSPIELDDSHRSTIRISLKKDNLVFIFKFCDMVLVNLVWDDA